MKQRIGFEVQTLRIESPIELITIVAATPVAAMTLWVLTQTLEKIANSRLNRDILILQRDKLRKELQVPLELSESELMFRDQLHRREGEAYFRRVEQHLSDSPVRIKEIAVTRVSEIPAKPGRREHKGS